MAKLTYIEHNGTVHEVNASIERSVMQIALDNSVPGIVAECGGSCSCGTCHVYIESPWLEKLAPCTEGESFMLEAVLDPGPASRLSCQIRMCADLDGMVVRLPQEQL